MKTLQPIVFRMSFALLLGLHLASGHTHGTSLKLTGGFTTVNKVPGWPSFVTLKDGSILAARGHMWCRSADGGRTWRKSSGYIFGWDPKLGSFPCDEPVVIELKDSRLMLLARSTIGQLYRVHSSDGGDNWDIAEPSGITSAYAPCMIRRIPTTGDLLLIWNQSSREEIESGYERNRLSIAISKDEGRSWTHAKTLFRSHVPAVGLIPPEPVTSHIGIKPFVGALPRDFATADYPNIHFHGDEVWFHYDRNPRFLGGAYWTLRIFPVHQLYE